MTTIYWASKTHHIKYRNEPYRFDIYNWRILREGRIYITRFKREETGVFISAQHHMRFLPHMTIKEVLHLNEKNDRDVSFEQFHISCKGVKESITYCAKCHGVGKFDWIQRIAPERRLLWKNAPRHFIRDESKYYLYPGFDNYIFAKAKLNPEDTYCEECQGFGILLDARYSIYRGMKGIKQKLYPIKAEDYNDKLKLKGTSKC